MSADAITELIKVKENLNIDSIAKTNKNLKECESGLSEHIAT